MTLVCDFLGRCYFRLFVVSLFVLMGLFKIFMDNIGTIVKRTVHNNFSGLFFGLPFTKLNPDFVLTIKEKFSDDSKLLIVCQEGLRLVFVIVIVFDFSI